MSSTIIWLIIMVVLIAIEVITMGLTTIWFAGGALVATIASAFGAPLYVQIVLALIVSIVLLYFTRPIAVKYFNMNRTKTNIDSISGKQAIVTEEIINMQGQGQVIVDGVEWSARSQNGERYQVGDVVAVKRVEGVKLIVDLINIAEEAEKNKKTEKTEEA